MYDVDMTGPDWNDANVGKWYAQNNKTLAYAFGDTPEQALHNLIEQEKTNG